MTDDRDKVAGGPGDGADGGFEAEAADGGFQGGVVATGCTGAETASRLGQASDSSVARAPRRCSEASAEA